jgi:hypothetical protein
VTVLVVGLTACVGLLTLLVLGLLRSHAEILRQLHALGAGREDTAVGAPADAPFAVSAGVVQPAHVTGTVAGAIVGTTPSDESVLVSVAGVGHDTLLAFLSTGCSTCEGFWEVFGSGRLGLPDGVRLVVVTQSPGLESESALAALAPAGLTVVMSTSAWEDYGVPGSPYFVLVDGAAGRVSGEGSATSWQQVLRLVTQASADREIALGRRQHTGGGAYREARADRELAAAGILPGDPSLYASLDELADDGSQGR